MIGLCSLHTPQNIASLVSHTVRGLRSAGYEARGLIYSNHSIQSPAGLEVVSAHGKGIGNRLAAKMKWFTRLAVSMTYCDVIHWYFGRSMFPLPLDIAFIRLLRKPALVEYVGSDIRNPQHEISENQYYRYAFSNGYEYSHIESYRSSCYWQEVFARNNFACAVAPGMQQYIAPNISTRVYELPRRLIAADFIPNYLPNNRRLLVVHSPSAPITKGTSFILDAINFLKKKYEFDFQLIQNMPHVMAMEVLQKADIFLDQFVLGDYGMASIEAMAYGKPVICFIKKSLVDLYGPDLPIVNASQETLLEVLEYLLLNHHIRTELGQKGRRYVEEYHDMRAIMPVLTAIYSDLVR